MYGTVDDFSNELSLQRGGLIPDPSGISQSS